MSKKLRKSPIEDWIFPGNVWLCWNFKRNLEQQYLRSSYYTNPLETAKDLFDTIDNEISEFVTDWSVTTKLSSHAVGILCTKRNWLPNNKIMKIPSTKTSYGPRRSL